MPFTPDASLDLLFPEELIPQHVIEELPEELHMRPLSLTDYHRGHLSVLSILTETPDVGPDAWATRFNDLRDTTRTYYIVVVVSRETDQIVASGGVFIERKFLRGLGNVGHIEDIAVSCDMQGKKLGLRIIQALTHISEGVGCYKTILNCSDSNMPFYEKCGFEKRENEMAKYAVGRARTPRL
jgi:glucosamine-phosphate N-acetyltransferase